MKIFYLTIITVFVSILFSGCGNLNENKTEDILESKIDDVSIVLDEDNKIEDILESKNWTHIDDVTIVLDEDNQIDRVLESTYSFQDGIYKVYWAVDDFDQDKEINSGTYSYSNGILTMNDDRYSIEFNEDFSEITKTPQNPSADDETSIWTAQDKSLLKEITTEDITAK